jgi:hypothetical protein
MCWCTLISDKRQERSETAHFLLYQEPPCLFWGNILLSLYAFTGIINIQLRSFKIAEPLVPNQKEVIPSPTLRNSTQWALTDLRAAWRWWLNVLMSGHYGEYGTKLRLSYITVNYSYANNIFIHRLNVRYDFKLLSFHCFIFLYFLYWFTLL